MTLDKLKDTARKLEQKEDWRRAIEVYLKAVEEFESGREPVPDLTLYNRVGDLHLKLGETPAAIRAYERAAELYADQGFVNNAIALCGKILRVAPGQVPTYLRLAQLHARKHVMVEARRHLLEYLDRMRAAGRLDDGLAEATVFADQFADNPEVRLMLAELVAVVERAEPGHPHLAALAARLGLAGAAPAEAPAPPVESAGEEVPPTRSRRSELVFLDTGQHPVPTDLAAEAPEAGAEESGAEAAPVGSAEGLVTTTTMGVVGTGEALPGLETSQPLEPSGPEAGVDQVPGLLSGGLPGHEREAHLASTGPLEGLEQAPELEFEPSAAPPGAEAGGGLVFLDTGAAPSLTELRDRVLEDPADPVAHLELGRAMLAADDRDGGMQELALAIGGYESRGDWPAALEATEELIRLTGGGVPQQERRAELAARLGGARYHEALAGLGDALARVGDTARARATFERLLELDPSSARARAALAELGDAPPGGFVDLGGIVLGDQPAADSRMRADRAEEPPADEDREFREILALFKRGVELNIGTDDFQAHYDLGVAYREMGLLDEAIAEFQKALRDPAGRLRSGEMLGRCFVEKGQPAVAEAVIRRVLEEAAGPDEEKVALWYWMGRAVEGQRRDPEAVAWYQRALAVDIRFMDLADRILRLTAEPRG